MTGLAIGVVLAVVAIWWVLHPIFPNRRRRAGRD